MKRSWNSLSQASRWQRSILALYVPKSVLYGFTHSVTSYQAPIMFPSSVLTFGDRKMKKTGSRQPQTPSPPGEADRPINNDNAVRWWDACGLGHIIMGRQNSAGGGGGGKM